MADAGFCQAQEHSLSGAWQLGESVVASHGIADIHRNGCSSAFFLTPV